LLTGWARQGTHCRKFEKSTKCKNLTSLAFLSFNKHSTLVGMTFLQLNHNSNVEKWHRKRSIAEKMKGRSFADGGAGKRD